MNTSLRAAMERLERADAELRAASEALQAAVEQSVSAARKSVCALGPTGSSAAQVERIKYVVAGFFQISVEEMNGKDRSNVIAHPRQIAMVIARQLLHLPLAFIGAKFNRDHGTVIHAERAVAAHCALEPDFKRRFELLTGLCEQAIAELKAA